jgi:hypothetical protein
MGLIVISNLLCVDLVVCLVGANKPDINNLEPVVNRYDQPVGVSLDIEYDTVIAKNACCPVLGLDVLWVFPSSFFRFSVLRPQRDLGVWMFLARPFQHFY